MPAKQLKMSLLQVFSEMTVPRETDSGKTLVLLVNRHMCLVAVSVRLRSNSDTLLAQHDVTVDHTMLSGVVKLSNL